MTSNLEQRVYRLEVELQAIQQQLAGIIAKLNQVAQNQWVPSGGNAGPSGGTAGYFGCTLSGDLPASLASALTGQTIWQIDSGARSNVTTDGAVWNDSGSVIPSDTQVTLAQNPDMSYTVVTVPCTPGA